ARRKVARKNVAGAEEVLKTLASRNSQSVDAANILADFYVRTGRGDEAERQFRQALKIDPNHPKALLGLAALQTATGHKQEAEEVFKQLEKGPNKRYHHLHAAFMFLDGRKHEATKEFEKLAKQEPSDREARSRLVSAYLLTDRVPDAEKVLTSALKTNPQDADALLQRAEIYLKSRRYRDARTDLTTVLRYKPDSGEAHHLLARVHRARGEPLAERQELTDAVQRKADLLQARIDLARNLLAANDARAALDVMNNAPGEQKSAIPWIVERNWALRGKGNWDEFSKGIAQGLALGRTADLLAQEALVKVEKRDFAGARSSVEEALK